MTYVEVWIVLCFFFQAEDGIRYLVRSRGLGDVYKRQARKIPAEVERPRASRALAAARQPLITFPDGYV